MSGHFTDSMRVMRQLCCILSIAISGLVAAFAHAAPLTSYMEVHKVPVSGSWSTVTLDNTYTSPVVVCTYNLPSKSSPDATIRIQNAGSTSFQIKAQKFETSTAVTASDAHCIIMEEGVWTLPDGRKIEAHKVLSDGTSGQYVTGTWGASTTENVSSSISHVYTNTNFVIVGQVMTYNDPKASVFWTFNCVSRGSPPTRNSVCVGKHIGMIVGTRANETLGYIAAEAGTGTVNRIKYAFALGPDTVEGTRNASPFNYAVSGDFDVGVLTQAAEDGGNGGWAVLYGNDPLPVNSVKLAIEEETFAGDTSRAHTTENVFYAIFDTPYVNISGSKTVSLYAGNGYDYALPGSDVIYEISASNTGEDAADVDTIFVVDTLPATTVFYNGDFDGAGPLTTPFDYIDTNSGLTFNMATDVGYSDAAASAKPASMADCTYVPAAGYDPNVRHICFAPKGSFAAPASATSTSNVKVRFRARIK